jgi:excisionase family DNA binding protein
MTSFRADDELLTAAEVAEYLGVEPVTVYRWCRSGRLPAMKLGKEWRIRRSALKNFLQRAEQATSLVGRLRSFYTLPDYVIAIAENEALLHQLDAAFFQIGEAQDALLVKFYSEEATPGEQLRAQLKRHGLDVERLEAVERLRFMEEVTTADRLAKVRQLHDEGTRAGRSIWITFDWTTTVGVDEALKQGEQIAQIVASDHLVIQTSVLEQIMGDWSIVNQRHARHVHRGAIWISTTTLSMSRVVPLPPG